MLKCTEEFRHCLSLSFFLHRQQQLLISRTNSLWVINELKGKCVCVRERETRNLFQEVVLQGIIQNVRAVRVAMLLEIDSKDLGNLIGVHLVFRESEQVLEDVHQHVGHGHNEVSESGQVHGLVLVHEVGDGKGNPTRCVHRACVPDEDSKSKNKEESERREEEYQTRH